jgi:hypothetical protein
MIGAAITMVSLACITTVLVEARQDPRPGQWLTMAMRLPDGSWLTDVEPDRDTTVKTGQQQALPGESVQVSRGR